MSQSESPNPTVRDDPYAPWRIPSYRFYFTGFMISVIGQQIQGVAVGLDVYQRTGDALGLMWVGLVQWLPGLLLALPAGQLADRLDRRRIVSTMQIGAAVTAVGMAIVGWQSGPILWLYVLLALNSAFHAVSWPARGSLMPQIIPRELFPRAAAWGSSGFQLCSVLGPITGGFLAIWSIPAAYAIDAVASVVFAAFVARLVVRPVQPAATLRGLHDLLEGVRFVWRTPTILAAITLDLFAVLLGGATALLPIFALTILDVGKSGLGWLRAAPAVGALGMALLLAHLPPMRHAGRNLLYSVAGFGLATVVFGLSGNFWLSWIMLVLTGAMDNVSVVIRSTLVQLLTPDAMRGRVSAVNNIFVGTSNELGAAESGLTAHWFGARAATAIGGIGTILIVSVVAVVWPHLRRIGSLATVAEAHMPSDPPELGRQPGSTAISRPSDGS